DLTGWWTEDGDQRMTTIAPVRADDSRNDPGRPLVPAETTRTIPLGSIIPSDATTVVANLTVTEPQADGFLTAFPCDEPFPLASNLNFRAGESRAVAIVVGVDNSAQLCVQSSTAAHIVLDVSGYYSPAPQFGPTPGLQPLSGRRVADSRSGQGGWSGKFAAGATRTLSPTAALPNASQTTAAVLNVVVTEAEADGFITIYPCDEARPTVSAVNYTPAGESTNMVVVDLSDEGEICVYALTRAHVVVDLFGVLTADAGVLAETLTLDAHTWPEYAVDGTDYIAECTGSSTDIGIELLRGATARVNGVPVTSGSTNVRTATDDRIRIELRRGSTVQNLSFRCVPDDFPRFRIDRSGPTDPGWYVTSVRTPGATTEYLAILDARGVPVWYKGVEGGVIDVQRRADGRLVFVQPLGPRYGVDPDRGYVATTLFGTVTEELLAVPDTFDPDLAGIDMPADHHEYLALPGGGRALLVYPVIDGVDLTVLGSGFVADDEIADGVIQEIAADDSLVWSWKTSDHFNYDVSFPIRWGPLDGYPGNEVDIYHLNSLQQVADGTGDYVVSARHMDNIFRVDRGTGAVDWVLGQVPSDAPQATKDAQLTIVGDASGGPRRPHDARLNGDVLTLYDNRTATGEPARALAYRIDMTARTATLLWQIEDELGRSSPGLGSNRITDDGTILVSWGGGIQPVFGEYTPGLDPLLEITQVEGGNAYRILKEPPSAFSLALLRAAAGGNIDVP
ncbi:aryl-sulfate sulfotransferase, partial [Ilumatobacter sp.]|uniref:aryl-sulfate sulfotransferase n=1 Tax=Ilumatobacter sp. TaxID=1967498 RepID=UPI003AF4EECB